jgi:glutamine cyclotransferase
MTSDDERQQAEIVREYGPFPGAADVAGVTYDGERVWFADGKQLRAFDPESGRELRTLDAACDAGTAYDGKHLYQIAENYIRKLDPQDGRVLAEIPAPPPGGNSGLAYSDGWLWVGQYNNRRILQVNPNTGEVVRAIESDRFVTGITWVEGELWHGAWEGATSELRRIDPRDGRVQRRLAMPEGVRVSGLESNGDQLFFCGGGPTTGKVRAVRRPRR